jgi:hypothetical protein
MNCCLSEQHVSWHRRISWIGRAIWTKMHFIGPQCWKAIYISVSGQFYMPSSWVNMLFFSSPVFITLQIKCKRRKLIVLNLHLKPDDLEWCSHFHEIGHVQMLGHIFFLLKELACGSLTISGKWRCWWIEVYVLPPICRANNKMKRSGFRDWTRLTNSWSTWSKISELCFKGNLP